MVNVAVRVSRPAANAATALMMPRPPALETAAASSGVASHCMPLWRIGYLIPKSSVILVFMFLSSFPNIGLGQPALHAKKITHISGEDKYIFAYASYKKTNAV